MKLGFSNKTHRISKYVHLLLHFCQVSCYFTEKYFIRGEEKSHDTAFTGALLFLWLAEMLRNGSEEECFENFRLPSWRSGVLGTVQKKSKSPKIRLSLCSFILASSQVRTSFPCQEKALPSL